MDNKVTSYSDIQKIIGSIFDILNTAKQPISFNVIAFFLFLKGENISDKIIWRFEGDPSISIADAIHNTIRDFYRNIHGEIAEILLNNFSRDVSIIDRHTILKIFELLDRIDNDLFQIYSAELIDDVFLEIARLSGKRSETYIQPKEITQLIDSLIELPDEAHVYNPFAGLASYGIGFKHSNTYYGQEKNQVVWALGIIRLIAHNVSFEHYLCDDSITNWKYGYDDYISFSHTNKQLKKFDLVVSTPPFNIKINQLNFPKSDIYAPTVEDLLMIEGIESIKSDGKFVLVASRRLLTSGGNSLGIRKNIIENDLLEMVITLPMDLFESTSISTSILIFNKKKKKTGFVKFVNGESFYSQELLGKKLKSDYLLEIIHSDEEFEFTRFVSNFHISEAGFNFNPNRYLYQDMNIPAGYKSIKLSDLISPLKLKSSRNDIRGKFIKVSDLANNPIDYEMTFSEKEVVDLNGFYNKLTSNALLVSRISFNLKPTYCRYIANNPLYLNSNIWAFSVKEDLIDIAYLINELYSEFVHKQLRAYSTTGVIPSINIREFMSVMVLVPSIHNQKEKVAEIRKEIILTKERELKLLRERFEQQTFEEFASLKHALGKPIPGINTALEYIFNYLQKNEGKEFSLDAVVSNRRNVTIRDKFNVAFEGLKLIRTLLNKGDNGLVLEQYPIKSCKIVSLIQTHCNTYYTEKFNVKIFDENNTIEDVEILANDDLFKILLNDVLSNANQHAFKDFNIEKNEVDIFLSIIDNNFYLNIANNGLPFPKNFDHEKFIQKYQKAGDSYGAGIGGYDINRIAIYCKGKFQLITDGPMDGFSSIYQFVFPLINAKEDE